MAKFNIDFTEAKEFVMCNKGEQNFKITNADLKNYEKDGKTKQKIELLCEVFGGESSGAKVFHSLFLANPTGLFMFLNKIGVKVEKKTYSNLDTNIFVGKTFIANVEHENYTGKDGLTKNKPVIIDTTIRKYDSSSVSNDIPDEYEEVEEDPFATFGVEIESSELPFE